MSFGDCFLDCLGLKSELSCPEFRVTLFGQSGVLISGVKKISEIRKEKVSFLTSKKIISVVGENLKITSYGEREVAVVGVINGVCIEKTERNG